MPPPREPPPGLREVQAAFGRGLRADCIGEGDLQMLAGGTSAAAFDGQFDVYRNNAWQFFLAALERTFPVLQKRVGQDFFRQLAREYRAQHPSRRGDLHWVGEALPAWLAVRLAGTAYAWLADLARLEWACEASVTAANTSALSIDQLGTVAPEALAQTTLRFQASMLMVDSPYPVWTVWQANQGDDGDGGPTDLAQGGEHCVVACVADRVSVYRLDPADYHLLQRLNAGECFGDAIASATVDAEVLARLLAWAFTEDLVVGISPSVPV
jgi:hypothetical protein